jgi:DNA polymerase (family X)
MAQRNRTPPARLSVFSYHAAMASTNQQLSGIFNQMADVLEILGSDRFRTNAFRKISRVLGDLPQDVAQIGADVKALTKLDGVGKGSAQRIAEFIETGKMQDHADLLAKLPPGLPELLTISGLGPKTIALIWKEAGVESKADLIEKLKTDELAKLPGFGKKKLENIAKSLAFAEKAGGRVRIGQAMPIAQWFVEQLSQLKQVKQCQYAGSLRRGKETIGDVDILVAAAAKDATSISDAFVALAPVEEILGKGKTKTSVRTKDNIQVDLRYVEPANFGAALMYFTGSKEHNIKMRERAIKQDMSLNEYALTNKSDDSTVASKTEKDIYKALGLQWIPPTLREDKGELIHAESNELPKLIELKDIKAELHAHTFASDGKWTISDFADAAIARGYHTIAITDHSKSQFQANGLDNKRLEQHIKDIHKVAGDYKDKITILAGSEVDILSDGKLDYPDSLLEQLDVVVASPHAALTQEPAKATPRLLKAIEHPLVTILGHPTGRIINYREGLSPDIPALIKAAKQRGIALEINANHHRLDLRDTHAKLALESGVKLAINTDCHNLDNLDELQYGVLTAQRAGAAKSDVVNCMTNTALMKWLKSTRA